MRTVFLDTNVFLRFFTSDDDGQHELATRLFRKARKGTISLVTGPPVLFEIAWTLRAAYKQPNEKILTVIEAIIALPGITLTDKDVVEKALPLARNTEREFADAYIVALAEIADADEIATFNTRHFKKLGAAVYRF